MKEEGSGKMEFKGERRRRSTRRNFKFWRGMKRIS